jgi:hypothetical protein
MSVCVSVCVSPLFLPHRGSVSERGREGEAERRMPCGCTLGFRQGLGCRALGIRHICTCMSKYTHLTGARINVGRGGGGDAYVHTYTYTYIYVSIYTHMTGARMDLGRGGGGDAYLHSYTYTYIYMSMYTNMTGARMDLGRGLRSDAGAQEHTPRCALPQEYDSARG